MPYTPSVYIETTIVSYLVAKPARDVVVLGHQAVTRDWWDSRLARVRGFVSQFVLDEAGKGDSEQAALRLSTLEKFPLLPTTPEAERLAASYLSRGLIPASEPMDALHLAMASAHGIDYLLTWNCRHLASASVRKRLGGINSSLGFPLPVLCTPEELMEF